MRYKDEQSFGKAVKGGADHRLYLLYGSEAYLIEKWAKVLAGSREDSIFNSRRLDGSNPDLEALWDTVEALPLFAQEKRVLLDDLDPGKLSDQDVEALGALLADIPPGTTLVITVKAPSFADSAKGKKLIKLAEAHGAALELSVRGQEDMIRFLQAGSKRLGCELDRANAKYLLEICPADMLLLENELRKICGYAGGGEISRRHIDGVATPKTEARVFDLQRLILNGRPEKALELLGRLFFLREDPIAILATLSMGFCDLYRARAARDAGDSLAAMMKNYGYKSEYRAKKAYEGAGKLSAGQLRLAVGMLCDCDRDMKSTGVNNKVYLEQLVVGLISLCGEGR